MIEAVNSVLSNAPAVRSSVEQNSTARSQSANPEKTQEAAKTPYVSPYISIDSQSNRAVLQIRDSNTGDVVTQYPSEGQLKAYQSAQRLSSQAKEAENEATQQTSAVEQTSPSAEAQDVPDVTSVNIPSVDQDA
jgi:uncharacterized FlaG/YvyC family protein